jgi:trigger factor
MRQEAMKYGPQAQQVFDLFRQNPNAQAQLRAPIFEDKVVDLIVGKAKVKDAKVSKDELMKDDDLPAGYGDDEAAEPAKKPAKKTAAKKTAAKKAD